MVHLAEGVCLNALLTLKVENTLICLVGTRVPAVSKMERQLVLPLKTLIRNIVSGSRRLEQSVLRLTEFKI
jgi:hypothetical protein